MRMDNRTIGRQGEAIASKFLEKNGYKIIDKNFQTREGEIDLIADDGREVLFCEVKTRTANDFGYPETAVDRRKIRHLLSAIRSFIADRNLRRPWRLDIISVEMAMAKRTARIRWFKDVSVDS